MMYVWKRVSSLQQIGWEDKRKRPDPLPKLSWGALPCQYWKPFPWRNLFSPISLLTTILYCLSNNHLTYQNQCINLVAFVLSFLPFVSSLSSLLSMTNNYHHILSFLISFTISYSLGHNSKLIKSTSLPVLGLCSQSWKSWRKTLSMLVKSFNWILDAIQDLYSTSLVHSLPILLDSYFTPPFSSNSWCLLHSTDNLASYLRHLRIFICSFYTLPQPHLMCLYHLHSHTLLP